MSDEQKEQLTEQGYREAKWGYWRTPDGSLVFWVQAIANAQEKAA